MEHEDEREKDDREKELVPVLHRQDIQEEELREEPGEQEAQQVPRRWYIY